MSEQKEQGRGEQLRTIIIGAANHKSPAELRAIIEAQAAENAGLRADRDRAQSACTAWQQVFESIEAYLQDRIAMDDPGQPETYLSIIRGDVAGVLRASEQIVAARWAHYRIHEARATAAEKALATAREDALEEAAKLAKSYAKELASACLRGRLKNAIPIVARGRAIMAIRISRAIRALKTKEPSHD